MRRNLRPRRDMSGYKSILIFSVVVLALAIITFGITYAVYTSKVKNEARISNLNSRSIGELVPNTAKDEETKSASVPVGKTIEEAKQERNDKDKEKESDNITTNKIAEDDSYKEEKSDSSVEDVEIIENEDDEDEKIETQSKIETANSNFNFIYPVQGEIIREFAKDNLVYSKTLKEWTTHNGIDIKADKTTVVKAAEGGIVKSIKNDPRYGITIIIEHQDGFKTVYSNLLAAEFVSEGDEVEKGQSIGTVGSSASFEVADEAHLHFEIWKDGETLNPETYLESN